MQIRGMGNFAANLVTAARFAFAECIRFRRVPGIQVMLIACVLLRDMPGAPKRVSSRCAAIPPEAGSAASWRRTSRISRRKTHPQKFHCRWARLFCCACGNGRLHPALRATRTSDCRKRNPAFFPCRPLIRECVANGALPALAESSAQRLEHTLGRLA